MAKIRSGTSGKFVKGTSPGQVLVWNGTEWIPGDAGGGDLAGDAVGPVGDNRVRRLSDGSSGGSEIPIASLADDTELRPLVVEQGVGIRSASLAEVGAAYDYVLSSRTDLVAVVAPVGGVFELPSGSYFLRSDVTLLPGESLNVANGVELSMTGSPGVVLLVDPTGGTGIAMVVESGATVDLRGVELTGDGDANLALEVTGDVTVRGGVIRGSGLSTEAVSVVGGTLRAVQAEIRAGASTTTMLVSGGQTWLTQCQVLGGQLLGISQTGGELRVTDCVVIGGTQEAYAATGGAVMLSRFRGCYLESGDTNQAVELNASQADVQFDDCEVVAVSATQACLRVTGATARVVVRGGLMRSTHGAVGPGVNVAGNITQELLVLGLRGRALSVLVSRTSGTTSRATVAQCDTDSTVPVGVDWASGAVPTNGLVELGCSFNTATPFTGHTHLSTRVNRKACTNNGGLTSETPIV